MRGWYREAQLEHGVLQAVHIDTNLVGLVEAWALGVDWADLVGSTSLDDGDCVRLLRRAMDVLRQIPQLPYVPDSMRKLARSAFDKLDRFPVTDDVTVSIGLDQLTL